MSNFFSSNNVNSHCFDITVVGGGLTGSLMVYLLLSSKNISKSKICWIKPEEKKIHDDRVSFYNFKNFEKLLERGFLNNLSCNEITQIKEIHVLNEKQQKPLIWKHPNSMGYIIKNKIVQKKLLKNVKNVKIFNSFVIKSISDEFNRTVTLEDGTVISSNLIIAADGNNSKLRNISSIKYFSHQLNHVAITGYLELNNSNQNIARQAFLKEGPIGLLPVGSKQNYLNYVWSIKENFADKILKQKNCSLIISNKLNKFYKRHNLIFSPVKDLTKKNLLPIYKWPLQLTYVPKPISQRLILIGDAAHSIHPLAGQGFNLALEDCLEVLTILEKSMLIGKDFGHHDNQSLYVNNRDLRVKLMTISTTSLFYTFTKQSGLFKEKLSKSMEYLGEKSIKNIFVKIANGL